ncbi:cytohesin 4a-related [Anaeramoeba flamelloides]|uniref:Cytohesin 4a-related n=1 Tax=Anaeramoeba flamelloides TaxID=1746091 RepID=A0AAV7ZXM7_9EUKA|nr:cytohesin 4a-related [Anaeramoeba flamelloides]
MNNSSTNIKWVESDSSCITDEEEENEPTFNFSDQIKNNLMFFDRPNQPITNDKTQDENFKPIFVYDFSSSDSDGEEITKEETCITNEPNNIKKIKYQSIIKLINEAERELTNSSGYTKYLDYDQIKSKIKEEFGTIKKIKRRRKRQKKQINLQTNKWSTFEIYSSQDDELSEYEYQYESINKMEKDLQSIMNNKIKKIEKFGGLLDNGDQNKNKKELLQEATKLFNVNPINGINYCIENALVKNNYRKIANFLLSTKCFGKRQKGELLGYGTEFSNKILYSYANCFNFKDQLIDDSLRDYLGSFRIPNEAQKIDKIMEIFSNRYHSVNTNFFSSPDTVYLLSFYIIWLNNNLHNSRVKIKNLKNRFFQNCGNIDSGNNLSEKFLTDLYNRIVAKEIILINDHGESETVTFSNPEKTGWLVKQGGRVKTWKKRWFLLSYNRIYYFKQEKDIDPCGIIPLEEVEVKKIQSKSKKRKFAFEICSILGEETVGIKFESRGNHVAGRHKSYIISASSGNEMDDWIKEIKKNIAGGQISKILESKKENFKYN